VRLLVRGGVAWNKQGSLSRWAPGVVELPWDRTRKVRMGKYRKVRGPPLDHMVIQAADGSDVEIPFFFLADAETRRFATSVRRFVRDVETDVDFV
jgi:hypothetical protein